MFWQGGAKKRLKQMIAARLEPIQDHIDIKEIGIGRSDQQLLRIYYHRHDLMLSHQDSHQLCSKKILESRPSSNQNKEHKFHQFANDTQKHPQYQSREYKQPLVSTNIQLPLSTRYSHEVSLKPIASSQSSCSYGNRALFSFSDFKEEPFADRSLINNYNNQEQKDQQFPIRMPMKGFPAQSPT